LKIYLVGGAVRDKLLGLPIKERDWVVVGATPEEMLKKGFKQVGKDFPVFLHPETQEEYALARTERKTGKGYYGFDCDSSKTVTLEEDLMRRDLTINTMAETGDGQIIDPFGGQQDLQDKLFRHVSLAFSEDPVRILRVARFASRFGPLGFKVANETLDLMRQMVQAGEVDALVPERVWQEMVRALGEADPTQFFLVLQACNALQRLWPHLDRLWGVPQPAKYHPEIDTGIHVMMALKKAVELSPDQVLRFAVVCHDLGKGDTPTEEWPSHRGHEERGVPLIKAFCERYRVPNDYRDLAIMVSRFHLHCHKVDELRANTLLMTLEKLDAFRQPERFEKFLLACAADAGGRLGKETEDYPQADKMRRVYQVAKAVEVKPLVEAGLQGAELGERLHQNRVRAIKTFLSIEH
jgi:tRNA nucleotidyltransferase (CCA-adding enzyme)